MTGRGRIPAEPGDELAQLFLAIGEFAATGLLARVRAAAVGDGRVHHRHQTADRFSVAPVDRAGEPAGASSRESSAARPSSRRLRCWSRQVWAPSHTRAVSHFSPASAAPQVPHLGYTSDVVELVEEFVYRPLARPVLALVRAAKRLQSGRLDAYLAYMLIALVAVLAVVTALG